MLIESSNDYLTTHNDDIIKNIIKFCNDQAKFMIRSTHKRFMNLILITSECLTPLTAITNCSYSYVKYLMFNGYYMPVKTYFKKIIKTNNIEFVKKMIYPVQHKFIISQNLHVINKCRNLEIMDYLKCDYTDESNLIMDNKILDNFNNILYLMNNNHVFNHNELEYIIKNNSLEEIKMVINKLSNKDRYEFISKCQALSNKKDVIRWMMENGFEVNCYWKDIVFTNEHINDIFYTILDCTPNEMIIVHKISQNIFFTKKDLNGHIVSPDAIGITLYYSLISTNILLSDKTIPDEMLQIASMGVEYIIDLFRAITNKTLLKFFIKHSLKFIESGYTESLHKLISSSECKIDFKLYLHIYQNGYPEIADSIFSGLYKFTRPTKKDIKSMCINRNTNLLILVIKRSSSFSDHNNFKFFLFKVILKFGEFEIIRFLFEEIYLDKWNYLEVSQIAIMRGNILVIKYMAAIYKDIFKYSYDFALQHNCPCSDWLVKNGFINLYYTTHINKFIKKC